ncbi:hypothetical protein [Streptomyces sp. NPDC002845]
MCAEVRPEMCLEVDLLAFPEAVRGLRRAVRERLGDQGAELQLCVTELVGNVIRRVGARG